MLIKMKQKGLAPILIVLLIALGVGGYLIYQKQIKPVNITQQTTQSTPAPTSNPESTTSADISNWKTYTNDKLKLSFKHPESYKQEIINEPTRYSIYLTKDTVYTVGGGQAGGNVLQKGTVISVTLYPAKSLVEKDLKSEYGNDIKINQVTVDQKQGTEIILPDQVDKRIYFKRDNEVIGMSLSVGFENNSPENQKYTSDFNQILSTFKFTQ